MDIKMFKQVPDWKAFDFVRYFYIECDKAYQRDTFWHEGDLNSKSADCMRMKRIIDLFLAMDKAKEDVKKFLDESIPQYLSENHAVPIDVPYLSCIVRKYLNLPEKKQKKKAKRQPVVLSPETQAWIKAERKRMAKENAKRRAK